jgi:hypothetical protein
MRNRVDYNDKGLLDEVVTDAGMHLEVLGEDTVYLCGHRKDGSTIAIYLTGRVSLVEERPAPDDASEPAEMAYGRFRVSVDHHGDVVLRRAGAVGRGGPMISRMWCLDQVEAALIAARNSRGTDAVCQVRALEWAMAQLRKKAQRD